MALGATKTSLYVALVYSVNRLAVGSSGRSDTPVISYQLQQQALIPPVARTIILNFGLNYAKRQWSHTLPQSSIPVNQETVVRQICVIKSLVTWNFERSASIARQKCGGWGYISKNRLAANVGYSHGSVTSEGDNAVIMQKVTKGLMSALRSGQHVLTGDIGREVWNVRLVDHCVELVGRVREAVLVKKVGFYPVVAFNKLMLSVLDRTPPEKLDAEIETRVKNGKTLFDVWMYEISDLVQHVALAYGERMCIEEAVAVIASIEDVSTRYVSAPHL
jgi:acyl-CoA oxidase